MCHSGVNTFGSWAVLWDFYCAEMPLLWSMLTIVDGDADDDDVNSSNGDSTCSQLPVCHSRHMDSKHSSMAVGLFPILQKSLPTFSLVLFWMQKTSLVRTPWPHWLEHYKTNRDKFCMKLLSWDDYGRMYWLGKIMGSCIDLIEILGWCTNLTEIMGWCADLIVSQHQGMMQSQWTNDSCLTLFV